MLKFALFCLVFINCLILLSVQADAQVRDESDKDLSIIVPEVTVSEADFGDVLIGLTNNVVFPGMIANTCEVPITIKSVDLIESDSSQFSLISEIQPILLKPGQGIDVEMGFTPLSLGKKNGKLRIITQVDTLFSIVKGKCAEPVPELVIEIGNIYFESGKYKLLEESYDELNKLADIIISYPKLNIEIAGHTDSKGTIEDNDTLSQKRAEAILEYLFMAGCNLDKLTAKGYGERLPVASNSSKKGQAKNRRVEIRFMK